MWSKKAVDDGKKPRRGLVKKIIAIVLLTLVVCAIVAAALFPDELNVDALRRFVRYLNVQTQEGGELFTFDAHNSNCYADFDGGLAVTSVGGLNTYDNRGRESIVSQGQLALPAMETGGELAVAWDVGGTTLLAVHPGRGEVLRVSAEKPILDVDVSGGGELCYLSSASGYKSVLAVYDDGQELIYRWLSSSTYMSLCAISEDGSRVATVGLGQQDGSFESSLNLFRTNYDQIEATVSLGSQLIYDLAYLDEYTICAVGESSVQMLSAEGEILGSFTYGDQFLKDFDFGGDGFLTLSLNMYRAGNRYTLVTVDTAGRQLAELYLGQEILDLSACGKYIAVLTTEGLTVYNRLLEVYAETEETGTATAVVMRKDGSVLLLGSGIGKLYVP